MKDVKQFCLQWNVFFNISAYRNKPVKRSLVILFSAIMILSLVSNPRLRNAVQDIEKIYLSGTSSGSDRIVVSFRALMKGPVLQQDDATLIQIIQDEFLSKPSTEKYNLQNGTMDPSLWQANVIRQLLQNKKNGFFIESGAYNGEFYSNTLIFEKDFGWEGVLIEPDPILYAELLSKHRKTWTVNAGLSPSVHPVQEIFHRHGLSTAIDDFSHQKANAEDAFAVQCFPLYSILLALNRTKVDYFSLDVEGVEFQVLKSIPWDKVNITTISVEMQYLGPKKNDLIDYMRKLGYELFQDYTHVTEIEISVIIDFIFYHPKLL